MSVDPTKQMVYPAVRYRDGRAGLEWLTEVLGLTEHLVVDGEGDAIAHAQLVWGTNLVMTGSAGDGGDGRLAADSGPAWIYLVADDVDGHHERVGAAGGHIIRPIEDEDYGNRSFSVQDPEGNVWTIGYYQPAPDEPVPG